MRERPILFSAPMVRAILGGRKTQTRRVMSPQPPSGWFSQSPDEVRDPGERTTTPRWLVVRCPHGKPGDRVWVREEHYRFGHWERATGLRRTRTGRTRWRFVADTSEVMFDAPAVFRKGRHHKDPATPAWHKRLARFMPRALSRMSLEVFEVRVQRLQEISGDDAAAEGILVPRCSCEVCMRSSTMCTADESAHIEEFAHLWDSIYGERAPWAGNPWVWAISFRRVAG